VLWFAVKVVAEFNFGLDWSSIKLILNKYKNGLTFYPWKI
jgi:hypothetical protein